MCIEAEIAEAQARSFLTVGRRGVGQRVGEEVTDEDHYGHVQRLEEPVPEELLRRAVLIEANDEEEWDHEHHGREDQVGQLQKQRKEMKLG
jgi:hypothetical protein